MLDKIRDEVNSHPVYMVGGYKTAYVTDLYGLYGDYGGYMYSTGLAQLGTSYEDFKNGIESGERFGDIQQIKPVKKLVKELTDLITDAMNADENPSKIYDNDQYSELYRVWINGRKTSLINDLINSYESIAALDEFLSELSSM